MPPPIRVELCPYDLAWQARAESEIARLHESLPSLVVNVFHIGSTAIPHIHAKPIIDLLPVVRSVTELDDHVPAWQSLGYESWGEYGIAGRRYFTMADTATGARTVQLHCFQPESSQVERHVAFRDYLRAHPDQAAAYDVEKHRCRALHPLDSHAYSDAKAAWIGNILPQAIEWYRATNAVPG